MNYILSFFICILLAITTYGTNSANNIVYELSIKSPIGPAVADYIERGIQKGIDDNVSAILLTIDTPGGLDKSMRQIVKAILASPIPILSYVYPSGSRAASAGTYILYASHIAAMAPGTNLGAATPINILTSPSNTEQNQKENKESKLETKQINDAIAYLESLATIHNRNKEWAKKAVKNGASLTEFEAVNQNIIDYVASNPISALKKASEKPLTIHNEPISIPKNITIIPLVADIKTKILTIITSPDIAYLLLIAGIYCLMFEFSAPGLIIPGVIGSISLILSLFGLNLLPLSWLGLLLIIIGSTCLIAEIFISSFGILGILGTSIFLGGSLILIEPNALNLSISSPIIMMTTLINILFFMITITLMIQQKKEKPKHGIESLIGKEGKTLNNYQSTGQIKIEGEIWNAKSSHSIKNNETIIVTNITDQTLIITSKKEKKS
ncbi:MAG: hypothetical protein CL503_01795 [Actinobacteria bacterium]|nr:hypothetical protein [Actinomycetota bacterium]|tara:strand:- start:16689 stop:18011 length:1323 start_codon:yes stop_codon:yes gene_type:complete